MEIEFNIYKMLSVLVKRKKIITYFMLLVSISAVAYALLASQKWSSLAIIRPVEERKSSFGLSSALASLGGNFLNKTNQETAYLATLMQTKAFRKKVVEKFDLIKYFELDAIPEKDYQLELAIKELQNSVFINISEETQFIYISALTKNNKLSADIVNFYCNYLDYYNKTSRMSSAKVKREFLEQRVNEIEAKINMLSQKFTDFQKNNKAISLPEQAKSAITLYSELHSQKAIQEIKLGVAKKNSKNLTNPLLSGIKTEIRSIEKKINDLEINSKDNGYILAINNLPDLFKKYAKLQLEIKIAEKVYEFLYPQLESARITEVEDLPTIEIIEKAIPEIQRTKPKRAFICIFAFIAGFIFICTTVIIFDMTPLEAKRKLKILWSELISWKKR